MVWLLLYDVFSSFFLWHKRVVEHLPPPQVVLPYPFEKINEVAEEVYRIYLECSPREHFIQVKSIDEAYFRVPYEGSENRRRNDDEGGRRSTVGGGIGAGGSHATRNGRISSSADAILNEDQDHQSGDADGTQLSGHSDNWNSGGNEAATFALGTDDESPMARAT